MRQCIIYNKDHKFIDSNISEVYSPAILCRNTLTSLETCPDSLLLQKQLIDFNSLVWKFQPERKFKRYLTLQYCNIRLLIKMRGQDNICISLKLLQLFQHGDHQIDNEGRHKPLVKEDFSFYLLSFFKKKNCVMFLDV